MRRDAGLVQRQQRCLDRQRRKECVRAAAQHRQIHRLRACVVRDARVDQVDRDAFQRNAFAPAGEAHRDRDPRFRLAQRMPQRRHRGVELAGQFRRHDAMAFDHAAIQCAHRLP